MEVECSIDTLGYLVIWLFGELHYVFTKLLVIVSVYSGATIQKTIHSAVDPLRKTIGPCDVGYVTYFIVITRYGTICVLWN